MTKTDLVHRLLAILVATTMISLAFLNGGIAAGLRMILFCTLPVFCISFPQQIGEWTGFVQGGRYIDSPSHPVFLRYAAWGLLIIPPIMIALTPILGNPR